MKQFTAVIEVVVTTCDHATTAHHLHKYGDIFKKTTFYREK